jgi:hypothetical protein
MALGSSGKVGGERSRLEIHRKQDARFEKAQRASSARCALLTGRAIDRIGARRHSRKVSEVARLAHCGLCAGAVPPPVISRRLQRPAPSSENHR